MFLAAAESELTVLMVRGLDGDGRAQAALLTACAHRLRPYYRRRLSGGDDVEDLVQETLIAVHTRRDSWDRARPLSPWLHAIARYKLMDHLRRHYARSTVALPDDANEWMADEDAADPGDALDVVTLLGELPANQRRWIRMTRIEGRTMAEAGEATGHTETNVKVGVHRGLKRLASLVQKDGL